MNTNVAIATMTLTGDPDIGTVIDADQVLDENHQPLAKSIDDFLRNTMQTLQLPPLTEGDSVQIQFSFRFGESAIAQPALRGCESDRSRLRAPQSSDQVFAVRRPQACIR